MLQHILNKRAITKLRLYTTKTTPVSYPFGLLNLKIGYIKDVQLHPNSDKMYVSQIQLANHADSPEIKQVCSGVRNYIPIDQFHKQLVVVVDNMKKCKLRGEISESMVLCGDDEASSVQICKPQLYDASLIGKQVVLEGESDENVTSRKIKSKEWEDISARLYVNDRNQAVYFDQDAKRERLLCVYNNSTTIPIVVEGLPVGSKIR